MSESTYFVSFIILFSFFFSCIFAYIIIEHYTSHLFFSGVTTRELIPCWSSSIEVLLRPPRWWWWWWFSLIKNLNSSPFFSEESNDPNVFEGDMILTPEQRAAAMNGGNVDAPIGRGSIKNKRWPGGVLVYTVNRDLGKGTDGLHLFVWLEK